MTTKTLDMGCGARPKNPFHAEQFYGVDVRDDLGDHVRAADLVVEPIPYDDDSFDYLTAFDFIEHIPRVVYAPHRRNAFIEFMNEVYRVLKPGGYFLSSTPAFPHAVAYRDPTHVNIITDETLPLYFDDTSRWAAIYGFKGAFHIVRHEWRGPHIFAVLRKVPVRTQPSELTDAAPAAKGSKVSVFVPVYNGAAYIAETLDSLLAQQYGDFEVLCLDDCSTDGSMAVLQQYAARDGRIRVLQTPGNLGNAARVLNYGLAHMTGDYFVYSSQDDLFSPDWLAKMVARAIETGADAVVPDVVLHHPTQPGSDRIISGLRGDRSVELTGREALQHSLDWTIPGNALWNADLVKFFRFAEFGLNADEYSGRMFFLNANKVVFSEGIFYYRQDNAEAVTKKTTHRTFDYPYTQLRLYQMLYAEGFPGDVLEREALKVLEQRNQLAQWLAANGDRFTPEQRAAAEASLARCTACMKADPMFAAVA